MPIYALAWVTQPEEKPKPARVSVAEQPRKRCSDTTNSKMDVCPRYVSYKTFYVRRGLINGGAQLKQGGCSNLQGSDGPMRSSAVFPHFNQTTSAPSCRTKVHLRSIARGGLYVHVFSADKPKCFENIKSKHFVQGPSPEMCNYLCLIPIECVTVWFRFYGMQPSLRDAVRQTTSTMANKHTKSYQDDN